LVENSRMRSWKGGKQHEITKRGSKVLVFDRDGTVETNRGPIPIQLIEKLKSRYPVYAYGNIALCSEAGIPYAEGESKQDRLRWVKRKHPEADEYIVVDNDPISVEGWRHYYPQDFLKISHRLLGDC